MNSRSFMNEEDRVLVERFTRTKDEATFRELYRRHTPALYLLALRLVGGSEADAQDAIQEIWIRTCRLLPTFEWRSSLRTWLAGILINRVREMNRGLHHQNEELPDDCPDSISVQLGERI